MDAAYRFYFCIRHIHHLHPSYIPCIHSTASFFILYAVTCLFTYEISTPYDSQLPRCRIIPYELTKALRLFVHNRFKISRDLLCTFKPCHHIKHPHNLTILLLQPPNADPVIFLQMTALDSHTQCSFPAPAIKFQPLPNNQSLLLLLWNSLCFDAYAPRKEPSLSAHRYPEHR